MQGKMFPFVTQPGIKRDGSTFSSEYWIDGQWMRFQRGRARKIGGYLQLTTLPNIVYGTYVVPQAQSFNVYTGDLNSLKYLPIDQFNTVLGPQVNRTPVLFNANPNNVWQFDSIYDTNSSANFIIAHAGQNLSYIDNNVETPVYYGDSSLNTAFQPIGQNVSGGVAVFHPFLFVFGNNGDVRWSDQNKPTVFVGGLSGTARVSATKIVAGLSTRAGTSSPGGLLWSLDSLIRVTFNGGSTVFTFDTVTTESSILSSSAIIEYDGKYIWPGVDRFLIYTGIVQELPNQLSLDYFYTNLNYSQRQKVWATKIPQFGEIWFHYPTGNSVECNKALIYNIRENTWYDTLSARSSGYFEQVFADPIWTSNTKIAGNYGLWVQETGYDQVINGVSTPIQCFIESGSIAFCAVGPTGQWTGEDKWVDLERFEPDFWNQSGDVTLVVNGREYANSPVISSINYTLSVGQLKQDMREQRREMTLRFTSNTLGGFFEIGQCLLWIRTGDTRP